MHLIKSRLNVLQGYYYEISTASFKSYNFTEWKVSKYGVFSGPYFPAFRLNTGKYGKHRVKSIQIRSFFWSPFSRISTEYGEILCICPFCVRMRESTDQQKLRIWTFFTQRFSFHLQFSHYGHGPSKILRNIQGFQNCQGGSLFKSLSNI